MKINKSEVRKKFKEKYGYSLSAGKMVLLNHGAGEQSIQIFKNGKLIAQPTVKNLW